MNGVWPRTEPDPLDEEPLDYPESRFTRSMKASSPR